MTGRLLRRRTPGRHARVTHVELFFDLVFVFAVTRISHHLLGRLTLGGALEAAFLLLAVWCVWIYTTWAANWLDPERPAVRLMLFLLMAAGLVMSISLPKAFGPAGLAFGAAYAAAQVGRTAFVLWAGHRDPTLSRNFQRIGAWLTVSGILWIAGGLAGESLRLAFWAPALAIEYVGPAVGYWTPGLGRSGTTDWDVEGGHMAERCGLFVIICLGESILIIGETVAGLGWGAATVWGFAVALTGSVAMWWVYFSAHAAAASEAIAASDDAGRIARLAYTYLHIPIVAGIIVGAAGDELVLSHPHGAASPAAVAAILGGPALFLAGALLFKFSIFRVWSASRLTGLGLLAILSTAGGWLNPLGLSAGAAAVLVLVGAWETLRPPAEAPGPLQEHA